MSLSSDGENHPHPAAQEPNPDDLVLDREVPWEHLGYGPYVDIARQWFGPLAYTGVETLLSEGAYRQYLTSVWHAQGYPVDTEDEPLDERERTLYTKWVNRDLGMLSVLGRTPRESQLQMFDEAAQLGHLVVSRTLEHADQINNGIDSLAERRRYAEEYERILAERDIWNARALHDPLTGHLNRLGLAQVMETFKRRHAQRHATEPVIIDRRTEELEATAPGIAEVDVDITYFKLINDELGHAFGDECIKEGLEELFEYPRAHDDRAVGRVGGDEFLLLLGNITPHGYRALMDRMYAAQFAKVAAIHDPATRRPTDVDGLSRYDQMWRRIRQARQAHPGLAPIVREETEADTQGKTRAVRVLWMGEQRIGLLRDMIVLSIGGAHSDQVKNVGEMGQHADRLMARHKHRLHMRMTANRPARALDVPYSLR